MEWEQGAVVEVKMKEVNCPLCKKEIYSEFGKSCKMCGMIIEDKTKDFCSRICMSKYKKINILNNLNIMRIK